LIALSSIAVAIPSAIPLVDDQNLGPFFPLSALLVRSRLAGGGECSTDKDTTQSKIGKYRFHPLTASVRQITRHGWVQLTFHELTGNWLYELGHSDGVGFSEIYTVYEVSAPIRALQGARAVVLRRNRGELSLALVDRFFELLASRESDSLGRRDAD